MPSILVPPRSMPIRSMGSLQQESGIGNHRMQGAGKGKAAGGKGAGGRHGKWATGRGHCEEPYTLPMPDRLRRLRTTFVFAAIVLCHVASPTRASLQSRAEAPKTLRLYVLDCGMLTVTSEGVERYHVTPAEV